MSSDVTLFLENQAHPAPEWVHLLPLGEVPLGDGREPLSVDRDALSALVQHFGERGLDVVIDYEHQTLSGHKAPAAGWIRDLEAREDGLWARVEWTDTAREHLAAREYRYFSPVLRLEDKTRRPLALLHAALTNTPAINGQTPLVARCGGATGADLPPADLPAGADGPHPAAGDDRFLRLGGQAHPGLPPLAEVALVLDLPLDAGLSRIKGAILALRRNLEHLAGAHTELAALRGSLAEREIDAVVDQALAAGKIQPCQQDYARSFAQRDLEGFKAFVAQSLSQVRLEPLPPWREPVPAGQGQREAPSRTAVCRALGVAPEEFAVRERLLRTERLL
jgi:phage I-like protein